MTPCASREAVSSTRWLGLTTRARTPLRSRTIRSRVMTAGVLAVCPWRAACLGALQRARRGKPWSTSPALTVPSQQPSRHGHASRKTWSPCGWQRQPCRSSLNRCRRTSLLGWPGSQRPSHIKYRGASARSTAGISRQRWWPWPAPDTKTGAACGSKPGIWRRIAASARRRRAHASPWRDHLGRGKTWSRFSRPRRSGR